MVMDKDHIFYKERNRKLTKKEMGNLAEYPFFYEGITVEEFEEEEEYYWKIPIKDTLNYKPLWKQRQEQKGK